ncbi:MAG: alanine racemase [Magnetococcales bacterium]|nr:alanine racemase [Magnetococcales bacterium]
MKDTESRLNYVKPAITRLESGWMNKFALPTIHNQKTRTRIDGVEVAELCEQYGSPLFVFSEERIRRTARSFRDSFSSRYPNLIFGWSYKTNYLNAISAIFHQEGSIAEVVSEMEYEKARALGVSGRDIIFNGPHKTIPALTRAAQEGAKIHIDHFDEIEDLQQVAKQLGIQVEVGIRINLDSGMRPQWSRFGFNYESGQALTAAGQIIKSKNLRLTGLHCHMGTFILDPEIYRVQVIKMIQFSYQLEERYNTRIEYLDIGGGFPSRNQLKNYTLAVDEVSSIDRFAEVITEAMFDHLKPGHLPTLILESGRAMIDSAGFLITSVFASKRLVDGRKSYILDAGVNLLFTSNWYKLKVEMDRPTQGQPELSLLNGPLCMNIDVVDEGVLLPPLSRGSHLILSPVGAYNVTQWMQFIEYRPAVVLITTEGTVEIIRQRESLDDMSGPERLPKKLRLV